MFVADSSECNEVSVSPNYGARKADTAIQYIVLHYTGMPDSEAALNWLCNEKSHVSCHYFIYENGRVVQLVNEEKRAWHAGQSYWQGLTDLNSYSIGIEIANPGHEFGYVPFPDKQIAAVTRLCKEICARRNILPSGILAHSDIAPDRKQDPGELFPWDKLFAADVGMWIEPEKISQDDMDSHFVNEKGKQEIISLLQQYGFNCSLATIDNTQLKNLVAAFQRRHRPERVDGILDLSTIKTLQKLLKIRENTI